MTTSAIARDRVFARNEETLVGSLKLCRGILRLIGAWPLAKDASTAERCRTYSMNVLCYLMFAFILIPGYLYVFLVDDGARTKLKRFGPLCTCSLNITKYSFLLNSRERINECLRLVREDWSQVVLEKDYQSMLTQSKLARTLTAMSICFIYGSGLFYRTILPLAKGRVVTPANVTIRLHASPTYFVLFDEQPSPAYELVFLGQFLGGFFVYSVACGVCGLAAFLVTHVCGQLDILIGRMNDLVEGKESDESDVDKRIARIIQRQTRTWNFVRRVEEILQAVCLIEIIGCTSIICLVLYCAVMEWENSDAMALFTYFLLLLSFSFNTFLICYIGELLADKGLKVGIASRTIEWHRLPTRSARSLIMVTAVSTYPLKIAAGKLMDITLTTFTDTMKTAVAYCNILRNVD